MNEVGAARDAEADLMAAGGPCPVLVFHNLEQRIGAVVHIDGGNAEQDGNDHVSLLARLLGAVPEIAESTRVYVCYDPHPYPGLELPIDMDEDDVADQVGLREAYAAKVVNHLNFLGFEHVAKVTEGLGKSVYLNTANSILRILDDEDNLIPLPAQDNDNS